MAKRVADKELTKDNWDEEDDNEQEAGKFIQASQEDLSKRKIIKARRRITGDKKEGGAKNPSSIFQGFTGFAGFKGFDSPKTTADPFASKALPGLGSFASTKPSLSSLSSTTTSSTTTSFTGFSGLAASNVPKISPPQIAHVAVPTFNGSLEKTPVKEASEGNEAYLESIKALNQGVSEWIQQHVNENPYIDLTPVFEDYRKHMRAIESKVNAEKESPAMASSSTSAEAKPKIMSEISGPKDNKSFIPQMFGSAALKKENEEKTPFSGLAAFSAVQSSSPLAVAATSSSNSQENKQEEDEDAPPKPVSVVKAEEGSDYSIRCKLFFKRDASWSELGVGMLNFKATPDNKTQLLIRADTATGKILLNIILSSSIPVNRSGKNNVMMMAMPNPPIYSKPSEGDNSKPATFLIRVKNGEMADELYEKMKNYQSS